MLSADESDGDDLQFQEVDIQSTSGGRFVIKIEPQVQQEAAVIAAKIHYHIYNSHKSYCLVSTLLW